MKPFLFLLGASLLLTSAAYAQVGVRVGSNLLNLHTAATNNDAAYKTIGRLGYQVGVYYQQPLTKRLSLVPEVQFSRELLRETLHSFSPVLTEHSIYDLRLSYLNVPVLLRLAVGPVHLEAGPQASVLMGGRGQGESHYLVGGDASGSAIIDQAATERYRRFDAGACVGVGVSLPAGLGLSVRAYQGFVALERQSAAYKANPIPNPGGKQYRQTLQASITYQLPTRQ